jgi:hypothetical protein
MSARGGARGGAFPSAHVSGALVVSLVAWRHQRRLAYLLVPITAGVVIATVYGRFHYALDTLAGAGLAIAVVAAYRYLSGDRRFGSSPRPAAAIWRRANAGSASGVPPSSREGASAATDRRIHGSDTLRQPPPGASLLSRSSRCGPS